MRILFTGGSGKAGRHVIPHLISKGHEVVNVDLVPLDSPGVDNLIADITDSGQMFNALTSYANLNQLDAGIGSKHGTCGGSRFDAVVHFAAIPRILIRPDNETFRINAIGTYNVLEAALKLGIRKLVFASSETTYGICFAEGEALPEYLPIDEEHPTVPEDSYAMSKVVNEVTARSFQRRSGADVYGLRINNVVEPHEYQQDFPSYFASPALRRRNVFAYIDARDLGEIVHLCLLKDGLGYQIFNAANNEPSVHLRTSELLEQHYQGVPVRRELGERESLYSNAKARQVLGFVEAHNWRERQYVTAPTGSTDAAAVAPAADSVSEPGGDLQGLKSVTATPGKRKR